MAALPLFIIIAAATIVVSVTVDPLVGIGIVIGFAGTSWLASRIW